MPTKKKKSDATQPDKAVITVRLFGGNRKPVSNGFKSTVRIRDGNQKELFWKAMIGQSFQFSVPFHDNFMDNYTVVVNAKDRVDAGFFPIKASPEVEQIVDLMLLADDASFHFLKWAAIRESFPRIWSFLSCGVSEDAARERFEELKENKEAAAAALLNLATAMDAIHLPAGGPLDYIKDILWDDSLAQDRFFGYADVALLTQVRLATAHDEFSPEPHPGLFHPDATSSYKQVQFGEANVQFTFHENKTKKIGAVDCSKVELDIDYFQDLGAHALLEVIPNSITHGRTDPKQVYVLRWIAGRHAGIPEFDPPYALE